MLREAGISQLGIEFVLSLMRPDPNDRPTTPSAKSNVWMKSVIPHHPEPTAPTLYVPSLLSPMATRPDTDGSASWTRKSSSDASEILSHDMSVPTTTTPDSLLEAGEIPNLARKTRDSSLHTEELRPIKDPFENLRPSSAELKFQAQAARALSRQEHNAEAETVFRQALKGQGEVLGQDHPETLNCVQWLGITLDQQGRYKDAEEMFVRARKGRERKLGPDHEDTLYSIQWLGISLGQQGQYKEAKRVLRRAFLGQERILGPDHAHTLFSAYWLGISHFQLGRYKEAVEIFERSVEGREKTLGPDHEDTLSPVQWLGNSLGQQDRWEEAERMFYRTYKGQTKVLGPDHPHTLHSAQCLGVALSKQRQYTDAETVLRGTLQRQEMVLGHDHEDYIYSRKLVEKAKRRGRSRSRIWLSNTSRVFSSKT